MLFKKGKRRKKEKEESKNPKQKQSKHQVNAIIKVYKIMFVFQQEQISLNTYWRHKEHQPQALNNAEEYLLFTLYFFHSSLF